MTIPQGLTEAEVLERRAAGKGNNVRLDSSRSYVQILRENAFTFINVVLFGIGAVLLLMERTGDAVVTAGLVLMNVIVGVVQEGRAKQKLDQIALLTRPKATVIREGQEKTVDPSEIVQGDLLVARAGDQFVADGHVAGPEGARLDVDESLLTGESDLIPKRVGDAVCSGSFCVTGSGWYVAEQVGAQSFARQMSKSARAFRQVKTPLQKQINFVIRIMVLLASMLGALLILAATIRHIPVVQMVQMAAVIVALVPQGLFFMTTVTYAIGAVQMSGKGALIQQANAVESLSNVDVLCLDKTGTLTTNRIMLHGLHPLAAEEHELRRILGDMISSVSDRNRTAEAIAAALPGQPHRVTEEVVFSSAYKWSAASFSDDGLHGVYVLGAPEVMAPCLAATNGQAWDGAAGEWAAQGLRVLLLASLPKVVPLYDSGGKPRLPDGLSPLGLIGFSDELRPEARETLQQFGQAGIRVKIISGDNPETVAALARQAGLVSEVRAVSGLDLGRMDEAELGKVAEETDVFGRITPQQKEALLHALQKQGHYVAMIGDGVNDVLSLKQAQLGIAMQSGSQATRAVADMVLLESSFAALPAAFQEGQRIVLAMHDIVRLFLARTFYLTLLILFVAVVGAAFPVMPKQNGILALLTVGIPTLALSAWARPGETPRHLLRSVSRFVYPAAFTIAVVGLGVYLYYVLTTRDVLVARTALTTVTVLCGLMLLPFVQPPTPFWVGGDELSGDRRPTILAVVLLAAYVVVMAVPALRRFFELTSLAPRDWLIIVAVVVVWAAGLRTAWRHNFFERLLNLGEGWGAG